MWQPKIKNGGYFEIKQKPRKGALKTIENRKGQQRKGIINTGRNLKT